MICADSSYSKFVQWQVKDLLRSPLASGLSASGKARLESNEWMTCDKFESLVSSLTNPSASNSKASQQANTRNSRAVNEILVVFDSTLRRANSFASPSSSSSSLNLSQSFKLERERETQLFATSNKSKVVVHGSISLGGRFFTELSPSSTNKYVGKEVEDNWFVKASNLLLDEFSVNLSNSPSRLSINTSRSDVYFLLAQSEGFNFRNKLVPMNELIEFLAAQEDHVGGGGQDVIELINESY